MGLAVERLCTDRRGFVLTGEALYRQERFCTNRRGFVLTGEVLY